jgi:N-acetylglutamate synthase-like GNAT family acetyltransferase
MKTEEAERVDEANAALSVRWAGAEDEQAILAMVRKAPLLQAGVTWRGFMVAEEAGRVVGAGRIKHLPDGSRELASLVVVPERRGHGIAAVIVRALLAASPPPVYGFCLSHLREYYETFAGHVVDASTLPPSILREYRYVDRCNRVLGWLQGKTYKLIAMRWDGYGS